MDESPGEGFNVKDGQSIKVALPQHPGGVRCKEGGGTSIAPDDHNCLLLTGDIRYPVMGIQLVIVEGRVSVEETSGGGVFGVVPEGNIGGRAPRHPVGRCHGLAVLGIGCRGIGANMLLQ